MRRRGAVRLSFRRRAAFRSSWPSCTTARIAAPTPTTGEKSDFLGPEALRLELGKNRPPAGDRRGELRARNRRDHGNGNRATQFAGGFVRFDSRSEEHTSELQSQFHLVC